MKLFQGCWGPIAEQKSIQQALGLWTSTVQSADSLCLTARMTYLPIVQTLLPSEIRACAQPAATCWMGGRPSILWTLGLPLCLVSGNPRANLSSARLPSHCVINRQCGLAAVSSLWSISVSHLRTLQESWPLLRIEKAETYDQLRYLPGRLPQDKTVPLFVRAMQKVPPAATCFAPPSCSIAYKDRFLL